MTMDMLAPPAPPAAPVAVAPIRVEDMPIALNQRVALLLDQGMQLVGTLTKLIPDPRTPMASPYGGGMQAGGGGPRSAYSFDIFELSNVEILGPGGILIQSHPTFTYINRMCGQVYLLPAAPPVPVMAPISIPGGSADAMAPTVIHEIVARVGTYVSVLTADAGEGMMGMGGTPVDPALLAEDPYGDEDYSDEDRALAQDIADARDSGDLIEETPVMEETVYVDDAAPPQQVAPMAPMGRDWAGWDAGVSKLQALLGDNVDAARATTLDEAEQESNQEAAAARAHRVELTQKILPCLPTGGMIGSLAQMGMAPPLFGYEEILGQLQAACGEDPDLMDIVQGLLDEIRTKARDAVTVRRFQPDMGGM